MIHPAFPLLSSHQEQTNLDSTSFQLWDLSTPVRIFTMFNSVFLMFNQLMFPETGEFVRNNTDFMVWLSVGDSRQGDGSDGESRSVVESEH